VGEAAVTNGVEPRLPRLRVGVVTLFPDLIDGAARFGVVGRALDAGIWKLWCVNPRDFTTDNYRTIDDRPYGGGPGMVMLAEPLERALEATQERLAADGATRTRVIYMSPQGERLTHARVLDLATAGDFVVLAGRYEGIDERLLSRRVDLELSLGDYVVSGGEYPALVLIDALVRQLPGVMSDLSRCHKGLSRRATRVDAGAAQLRLFHQRHAPALVSQPAGQRSASLASSDHNSVKFHDVSFPERLEKRVVPFFDTVIKN